MIKNPRRNVVREESVTEPFFATTREATYGVLECGHRELLRVNGSALRSSRVVACAECGRIERTAARKLIPMHDSWMNPT